MFVWKLWKRKQAAFTLVQISYLGFPGKEQLFYYRAVILS